MSAPSIPDELDPVACLVRALALYSIAEAQLGHATTVRVRAEGAAFSVSDDGRGHAIQRTVGGSPYLRFVYEHLDYPFETAQDSSIQLHGIGMSLINVLCRELSVTARKRDATLRMTYRDGKLLSEELSDIGSVETGNTITGTIHPQLQLGGANPERIRRWLRHVRAVRPSLKLFFNDEQVHASLGV